MAVGQNLISLFDRLKKNRFLSRLLTLSFGTGVGQALMVLSTPFLTRLYTPAEFGVFAVFSALFGMFCGVMCLRYEIAIPVVKTEIEAAGVSRLCFLTTLFMTALLFLLVWLGGDWLAARVEAPELGLLLYLLPPALMCWGLALPLNFWSIRRASFRLNAANRILQYATQAAGQLILGVSRLGTPGLILGFSLGHVAKIIHFAKTLPRPDRDLLGQVRSADMLSLAKQHWRYPAFSTLSTLFQSTSQLMPAMLVAAIYGPVVAGWFALSQRIMGFPVMMIGDAASNVFLNEIANLKGRALYRMFCKTVMRFFIVALLIMLPVFFIGPSVFAFVFGEAWRETGQIVQVLVPLYVVRFTAVSVSQTLNVLGRQDLHLVSSTLNFLALIAAFACGWIYTLEQLQTFGLYSLGSMLAFATYVALAWWTARNHALKADKTPG